MKKSEKLKIEAEKAATQKEAFYLYSEAIKEEKKEKFELDILPKLREKYTVLVSDDVIVVETEKYNKCLFDPKTDKLFRLDNNTQIKQGLNWIKKNLLRFYNLLHT